MTIGPRVIAAPEPSSTFPGALCAHPGHIGRIRDVEHECDLGLERMRPQRGRRRGRAPPAPARPRPPIRGRRLRRSGGPLRAPHTRRGGCRARARRSGRSEARRAGRHAKTPASPGATRAAASSALAAPMSTCRSSMPGDRSTPALAPGARARADDTFDGAPGARDHHALAGEDLGVEATERGEVEQPVAAEMRDRDPDLVDVPENCEGRAGGAGYAGERRPERVARHLRELGGGHASAPDRCRRLLVSGTGRERRADLRRRSGTGTACGLKQERLSWGR